MYNVHYYVLNETAYDLDTSTIAGGPTGRAAISSPGSENLQLTCAGEDLLGNEPEVIDLFTISAAGLARSGYAHKGGFEYIGRGNFAHVYGISDDDRYCIKVVSQDTMRDVWKSGFSMPVTNLFREVKFMDAIQKHLAAKVTSDVCAPRQFAAVSFRGGMASLQERIPEDFKTLRTLRDPRDNPSNEEWLHAKIAYARATTALADSPLRLGVGDMVGAGGYINLGNFLLHHEMLSDGPVYVVDLIGRSIPRRVLAAGAVALGTFSKHFLPRQVA